MTLFSILLCGIKAVLMGFAIWLALSWRATHAILKNPIQDGYATVEDLLFICFVIGIIFGIQRYL